MSESVDVEEREAAERFLVLKVRSGLLCGVGMRLRV